MPKSLISPRVLNDERFTDMGFEARALYPHLLMASDYIGAFANIKSIARGCGIKNVERAVKELVDCGYIAPVKLSDGGTAWLVLHWFTHNNHDAPKERRSQYCAEVSAEFHEINGVYTRTPPEPRQNPATCTPNQTKRNQTKRNGTEPKGRGTEGKGNGEGEPPEPVRCPKCGAEVTTGGIENGYVQFECMECREFGWLNTDTGEVAMNPFEVV